MIKHSQLWTGSLWCYAARAVTRHSVQTSFFPTWGALVDYFVSALRQNPELAIFLTIAVGFLIGGVKFGSFSLGIVVGCLLAGVLIGQLDIKVSPLVKTVFFDLFLFTTGYKVGPQFFRGLKSDALPQMALTVVLCVSCLLAAFGFSKLLGYDVGTAAGLLVLRHSGYDSLVGWSRVAAGLG